MDGRIWLDHVVTLFLDHKQQCERAAARVSDEDFFAPIGRNPLSIATLMKHVGGNHRSRWRDFLTTDGEKRDRNRDDEFSVDGETRASILATWDQGWAIAIETLGRLQPADLERTVTIRGQPMSCMQAIQRNLLHVAYHAGQVVHVARHHAGDAWQTMSIAPGGSDAFNAKMRETYGDWWEKDHDPR